MDSGALRVGAGRAEVLGDDGLFSGALLGVALALLAAGAYYMAVRRRAAVAAAVRRNAPKAAPVPRAPPAAAPTSPSKSAARHALVALANPLRSAKGSPGGAKGPMSKSPTTSPAAGRVPRPFSVQNPMISVERGAAAGDVPSPLILPSTAFHG